MSSPSAIPPPAGGDQNRAGAIIAIYWTQFGVALVVVSLRMWARKINKSIGWDDWSMLLGLVFQLILAAFVLHYALIGGTRHLYYIPGTEIGEILKWLYILQCWGILAFIPPKVSVALLIIRLLNPLRGWRYKTLVISITLMIILNVLTAIFTFVQCNPAAALWDKSIKDAKCWQPQVQSDFGITQASFSVFVDVVLAVIPATILYKLKISTKTKVGLTILLGLGLIAAAVGIVKTTLLTELNARSDLTWKMYDLVVWSGTENWVVLLCGSVPPLKVLWDRIKSNGGIVASLHLSNLTNISRRTDETAIINHSTASTGIIKNQTVSVASYATTSKDSVDRYAERYGGV